MQNFAHLSLVDENLSALIKETMEEEAKKYIPEPEVRKYEEINTLYFHFPTFDYEAIERDRDLLKEYQNENAEYLILDITGNSGGSDYYWIENIVENIGKNMEVDRYVYLKDTSMNRGFLAGCDIQKISEKINVPSFAEKLEIDSCFRQSLCWQGKENSLSEAKCFILVDEAVYSSADSFANLAQESGWATIVGYRTMGDGDCVGPVYVDLPNTGLTIRFSSTCIPNKEGELNAQYGTIPDIKSVNGERPITTCLRLIEKLQEKYE